MSVGEHLLEEEERFYDCDDEELQSVVLSWQDLLECCLNVGSRRTRVNVKRSKR